MVEGCWSRLVDEIPNRMQEQLSMCIDSFLAVEEKMRRLAPLARSQERDLLMIQLQTKVQELMRFTHDMVEGKVHDSENRNNVTIYRSFLQFFRRLFPDVQFEDVESYAPATPPIFSDSEDEGNAEPEPEAEKPEPVEPQPEAKEREHKAVQLDIEEAVEDALIELDAEVKQHEHHVVHIEGNLEEALIGLNPEEVKQHEHHVVHVEGNLEGALNGINPAEAKQSGRALQHCLPLGGEDVARPVRPPPTFAPNPRPAKRRRRKKSNKSKYEDERAYLKRVAKRIREKKGNRRLNLWTKVLLWFWHFEAFALPDFEGIPEHEILEAFKDYGLSTSGELRAQMWKTPKTVELFSWNNNKYGEAIYTLRSDALKDLGFFKAFAERNHLYEFFLLKKK